VKGPFNLGQYWLNPGDDSVTLHCRTCGDGVFARPGDQYWQLIGPAPGLDLITHIARQHHDTYHQE
jgi:hypothetical protein